MIPSSPEAVRLFHEGSIALSNVESNGFRIDTEYLDKALRKTARKIKRLEDDLQSDEVWRDWKKEFGSKAKLGSGDQLAHMLFSVMGLESKGVTATGKHSTSDAHLMDIDLPFVQKWRELTKLQKANGTFLEGIKKYVTEDGFLHADFNLNLAATFRSSSSNPNLQNFPIRTESIAKLIRRCFVPRKGHRLVSSDFSGVEVGVACCYNKDPQLIYDYTEGDMHRDMAIKCYRISPKTDKDWWKVKGPEGGHVVRYCAKNMYVFPEFYGSYYVDCARNLWDAIERLSLHAPNGLPMREYLRTKGIKRLGACDPNTSPKMGTFEHHIQKVEDDFWNVRYRVYNEWKKTTWEEYKRKGYTKLLTGFVCSRNSDGHVLNRKQVINYRIQGAAFHCLLWVLIEMDKWLRKNKMRSKIVSQIHDDLIGDVHEEEYEDYIGKVRELMTETLRKTWKWIIVPLSVEIEASEVDGNWYDKSKVA